MTVGEAKKMLFNFFVENNFDINELKDFIIDYIEKKDLLNKNKKVCYVFFEALSQYEEFKMGDKTNDYNI